MGRIDLPILGTLARLACLKNARVIKWQDMKGSQR